MSGRIVDAWMPLLAANTAPAAPRLSPPSLATLGMAVGVFVLMAVLAWLFGPAERRRLRVALILMLAWAVTTCIWLTPFLSYGLRDTCELVSMVTLALAAVRVSWLFIVDWALRRGQVLGISRISRDLMQATLYIVVAIAAARAAGADPQALATTGGLVTAGLTFSLQQTLGDLVAGLLLQAQAPFKVGDWIAYDENARRLGRVREINWRATTVITMDHVEITVPNSVLAKAAIINFNEPSEVCRRSIRFVVGYEHPPRSIIRQTLETVRGIRGVLEAPASTCLVEEMGNAGVHYWLRYFIDDMERRDQLDSEIRTRLWYAFKRLGVEFVFPRTDIALVDASGSRAEADEAERRRRAQAFDRIDFLSPLSHDERVSLAGNARTQMFTAGEIVVREGEKSSEFYIVADGRLTVLTESGRKQVARLEPGDFFGEMALLTGEARSATVKALDDCVLYVIDRSTFQTVLAGNKSLIEKISKILAERQSASNGQPGETDATGEKRLAREETVLAKMRRFFGGH